MKTIRPYRRAPAPRILAAALALAFSQAWPAWALPEGNTTAHGVVEVGRPDASRMVIRQASDKAIVNWQGFSIGAGEQVRIEQPGAGSAILNRVTGASRSEIQGRLDANGKVFLINRNGVVFGEAAAVNVGSLVASTLDIDNDDFVADRLRFRALEGPAAVENAGSISVAERGTVALMGGRVANNGTIRAQLGTVAMAAGEEMTLEGKIVGKTRAKQGRWLGSRWQGRYTPSDIGQLDRWVAHAHHQRRQGSKAETRQPSIALPTCGPQPLDITGKDEGVHFGDTPNLYREKEQGKAKEAHQFFTQDADANHCPI